MLSNKTDKYDILFILIGVFYLLLLLAINSALIDIVVSPDPRIGLSELDNASRGIASIALCLPASIYLVKYLERYKVPSNILIPVGVLVFMFSSYFITSLMRNVIDSYVEKTSTEQQRYAIGAVIGINAYSHGAMSIRKIGLNGVKTDNVSTKVAAVYFVPYLALSGKLDHVTTNISPLMQRLMYKTNQVSRPVIERKLGELCSEAKQTYQTYLLKSEKVNSGFFIEKKHEYAYDYRDKTLGYRGTIGLGLDWNSFIHHRDIQITVRDKMATAIGDIVMSPQLEYIFSKSRVKEEVLGLFNRKYINPCIGFKEYMLEYGAPIGTHYGKVVEKIVVKDEWPDSFVKDGVDTVGKKAVYALLSPPVGVIWTLLALVVALGVVAYRIVNYLYRKKPLALVCSCVVILAIIFIPFLGSSKSDITMFEQATSYMETSYEGKGWKYASALFEWSTKVVPVIYPIGYFSRKHLVGVVYGIDAI